MARLHSKGTADDTPVTEEEAKAWVESRGKEIVSILGLSHWAIAYKWTELEKPTMGLCSVLTEYRRAEIEIDMEQIKTMQAFLRVFYHELSHILLADMNNFYNIAAKASGEDPIRIAMLEEAYRQASEQIVTVVSDALVRVME